MLELSQLLIEQGYLPILLLHHLKELDMSSSQGAPHASSSVLIAQLQLVSVRWLDVAILDTNVVISLIFNILYCTIQLSNAMIQIMKSKVSKITYTSNLTPW